MSREEDEAKFAEHLETAKKHFAEVKRGWESNKSLEWELAVHSLNSCLRVLATPEAQSFLDEFLMIMIRLLTSQSPKILGNFEKKCIDESLTAAIHICVRTLSVNAKHLPVLIWILDPTKIYYAGMKVNLIYHPGCPTVRMQMARKFADLDGFRVLLSLLRNPNIQWMGAESLQIILKSMTEMISQVDEDVRESVVTEIMKRLMALTDEQAKRENTDSVGALIKYLSHAFACNRSDRFDKVTQARRHQVFHNFWLEHTLKAVNSGSLVLRLFGWEQVLEIIKEAIATRPFADSYLVKGAGNDDANGVYKRASRDNDGSIVYTKEPTRPDMPMLTLFRCAMRNKSKWWFISQADKDKPGTEKDIDYYQHKSTAIEDREPQLRGWVCVTQNMQNPLGKEPAPTLQRVGKISEAGAQDEDSLSVVLPKWAVAHNLLGQVFKASPHREVILRSIKLVQYLAEVEMLQPTHLDLIWKCAMQAHDVDIEEEVFGLLTYISLYLSDELYAYMIDLALLSIKGGDAISSNSNNIAGFSKVAHFVEKFAKDNFRDVVGGLSEKSSSKLLSLVWTLYRSPQFETLKSALIIQDFLSKCLGLPSGRVIALKSVRECVNQLETVSTSGSAASVTEAEAARIIHTLQFLISKNISLEGIQELDAEGLPNRLVAETKRFVECNREKARSNQIDQKWYTGEILNRLLALHHFYGTFFEMKMPLSMIDMLWQLFRTEAMELEMLFVMLKVGASRDCAIGDFDGFLSIFKTIICNNDVDWSKCGDEAFSCFETYFQGLEVGTRSSPRLPTELPPRLGLDTLWKITLNIPNPGPQRVSMELLIKSYEEISLDENDAHEQMIKRVFNHLAELKTLPASPNPTSPNPNPEGMRRCVELLHAAIMKSKASMLPAHSMRGRMQRMRLNVHYRRVTTHYNYAIQQNTNRTEKGSECMFVVDVHPMHTVMNLKEKIAMHANLPSGQRIMFDNSMKNIPDSGRLIDFGVVDGSDIPAYSYLSQMINKTNFDVDNMTLDGGYDFESRSLPSIGESIAETATQFDTLLNLAGTERDPAIAKRIWQLVMLMPTQPELLADIESALSATATADGPSEGTWGPRLNSTNLPRRTYILQIIDHLLQPAFDVGDEMTLDRSDDYKKSFIASGGFSAVLDFFASTVSESGDIRKTARSVALHILHHLLFNEVTELDESSPDESSAQKVTLQPNVTLFAEVQTKSAVVIEMLLSTASAAAAAEESGTVNDALFTLNYLLKSPAAAAQLIGNAESKSLLVTVLRSGSKEVREMAADFAIKVGKTQPVVFSWLLAEIKDLSDEDTVCSDTFRALGALMIDLSCSHKDAVNWLDLATFLTQKLIAYSTCSTPQQSENQVLQGFLNLLESLIKLNPEIFMQTNIDILGLTKVFVHNYLFALPSESMDCSPICDSPSLKRAVFGVLSALVGISPTVFGEVLGCISNLSTDAAAHMRYQWGLQISYDVKRSDIAFSGLKNQGCTCYMNSLLQLLFMNDGFRESILRTPLKECHRTSLTHIPDDQLKGREMLFEWCNNSWRKGTIISYDKVTSEHVVEYNEKEIVCFNIHDGRNQAETGRFRLAPVAGDDPATEAESSAYRVVEQLQRTFCFMKNSKRRYFDPRPFVDACKSLNLSFNVYHQNDASEFCDQLLDRIETGTKGKHTKKDMWGMEFMSRVFGGKQLYQKIPMDCDTYIQEKKQCGHWQSSRQESFIKLELLIRGKDNVYESLSEFIAGELMDGDNKINCEVCAQKKATTRRTCIDVLPNLLILHLKRFDLDFTTFETVKLNNRMSFDNTLNMLKFTKEGLEAEARKAALEREKTDPEGSENRRDSILNNEGDWVEPDPEDYEYELQGVLVHAGIAQGGHYYSFIRESNDGTKWYRFDDEDVTLFNPEHIPSQCFGGPPSANNAPGEVSNSKFDEDRTSNALMLFYNKKKPIQISPPKPTTSGTEEAASSENKDNEPVAGTASGDAGSGSAGDSPEGSALVDGYQAFSRELREWNLQHLLSRYMLDPDLHSFVRDLLSSIVLSQMDSKDVSFQSGDSDSFFLPSLQWLSAGDAADLALNATKFGTKFLFDVVLHCRERAAMRAWITIFKNIFETFPLTAVWLLQTLLDGSSSSWMDDYFLQCSDALARNTFVQIVAQATLAVAPKGEESIGFLSAYESVHDDNLRKLISSVEEPSEKLVGPLLALLVQDLLDKVLDAPAHTRVADEIFTMIRDVAAVPCICAALINARAVSLLAFFATPDGVSSEIRSQYAERMRINRAPYKQDCFLLLQSVFEALAALLGVPQLRKVPLLQERSTWDLDLVPEARDAFTTLFNETARKGGMDASDIIDYRERSGVKVTVPQARVILDRFHTTADGRLSLEGFLQFYADLASYSPKDAWKDLHSFGYKNDLTRNAPGAASASGSATEEEPQSVGLPEECRRCLSNIQFYQSGLETSEAAAKAIAKRMCANDEVVSTNLIRQALERFAHVAPDWSWGNALVSLNEFIRLLLSVDDGLRETRLREIMLNPQNGLAVHIIVEMNRPSNCRANDYDRRGLMKRYVSLVQDLVAVEGVKDIFIRMAETDPPIRIVKGHLKARPDSHLTENEENMIKGTTVYVENAGTAEVNGEYKFTDFKCNAGMFTHPGTFNNKDVVYTLYKCSVVNGGYQWFISVVPDGMEPGTNNDIDFYFALSKNDTMTSILPPLQWSTLQNKPTSRNPAPQVKSMTPQEPSEFIEMTPAARESDSDRDVSSVQSDDLNDDADDSNFSPISPLGMNNYGDNDHMYN